MCALASTVPLLGAVGMPLGLAPEGAVPGGWMWTVKWVRFVLRGGGTISPDGGRNRS